MAEKTNRGLQSGASYISLICAVWVFAQCVESQRQLSTTFLCHPDSLSCPAPSNVTLDDWFNLAYTKAEGDNDTLHYLISSYGTPSVVMARTGLDSNLTIDWNNLMSGDPGLIAQSISFSYEPQYISALLFPRYIQYDDSANDTANIADAAPSAILESVDLSKVRWQDSANYSSVKDHTIVLYSNVSYNSTDAYLKIQFEMFGNESRSSDMPHLQFTSDTMHITASMSNLETTSPESRFALEMVMITTDEASNETAFHTARSLDDGHSPGVFEMINLNTHGKEQTSGAFLQWKPVAYTGPARTISVLTLATHSDLINLTYNEEDRHFSIPLALFGGEMYNLTMNSVATNMSFGQPDDKFFEAYKYSLWTFAMGFGQPPEDKVSLMIILIISIGLGIPVLLIIFGGIGICIKRRKDSKPYSDISSSYSTIQ